jgi:DNA (cytosine-5)-methyltransferase 1
MTRRGTVIDLFAGAGGWDEALRLLGVRPLGIETDRWACATAGAAGHARLQADVAELDPDSFAPVVGLVASPPCQSYASCGQRLGLGDEAAVLACAHELAAGNDTRAARRGECLDPRSLLSVEPLRWALALRPRWVAFEQVPAVLGLWTTFAGLLGVHGYQCAVGSLSAERFGVPQARKRAFLIASLDGPVRLPEPTHRAYNPRRQGTLPGEARLRPWATTAGALRWRGEGVLCTHQTYGGRQQPRRALSQPAFTLVGSASHWTLESPRAGRGGISGARLTPSQAGVLQGFQRGYPWQGSRSQQFRQIGNAVCPPLARQVLREARRPTRSAEGGRS